MTPYTRPAAPQTSTTCYAASAFRAVLGSNQGSAMLAHLTLLNSPSGPILSSDTPLQTGQEYELISIQILKQTSAELIPLHAI